LLTAAWALHDQIPLAVAASTVALYLHARSNDQPDEFALAILKGALAIVLIAIAVFWLVSLKNLDDDLTRFHGTPHE
jgi:hypothetical protein